MMDPKMQRKFQVLSQAYKAFYHLRCNGVVSCGVPVADRSLLRSQVDADFLVHIFDGNVRRHWNFTL